MIASLPEVFEDIRILILEDNPADRELLEYELRGAGYQFTSKAVENRNAYTKALQDFQPDLILSDYDLPGFNGAEALKIKKKLCPNTPFIIITGAIGEESAIEILTGGATDYILKRKFSRLIPAIRRALCEAYEHRKRKEAEIELERYRNQLSEIIKERTYELEKINAHLKEEIKERQRIENQLKESNEELSEAQRVTKVGSWSHNLMSGKLHWSEELYRIFELEKQELDIEHFVNLIHPEDISSFLKNNQEVRFNGKPLEHEYRIITSAGVIKYIRSIGYSSKNNEGTVVRLFGTAQDVTEYKQVERAIIEQPFRAYVSVSSEILCRATRIKRADRDSWP
jgi:PAS domain S-box-containing protein